MAPSFSHYNGVDTRASHRVLEIEATKNNMLDGLSLLGKALQKITTYIEDHSMCLTWKDLIVIVTNAKGELHRFL